MSFYELKNNKYGMTLIEMIISLVILSILTTSTMGMIVSSNSIFISTSKAAIDRQVGNGVFDLLKNVLRYSTHLTITNTEDTSNTSSQALKLSTTSDGKSTNSGYLFYRSKTSNNSYINLYDESFYNGRTVQYSIRKIDKSTNNVEVTVKVFRDGEVVYYNSTALKCINLNLITSGVGSNPISDSSTENSVNQYIYFVCDEQLISGGSEAWSIEQKINSYMQKYNGYLKEYYNFLLTVEGYYETEVITNHKEELGGRISLTTYTTATNNRKKAIFGDGTTATTDFSKEDSSKYSSSWCNLRGYYQTKIYELLHFTPTGAATSVSSSKQLKEKLSITKKINNVNKTYELDNPYYGVVATKEELYMGFLLEYYDGGDNILKASEYPSFENPNTFFKNTIFTSYINKSNPMVIMAYFNDYLSDNYSNLFTLPTDNNSFYEIKVTARGVGLATEGSKYKTTTINASTDDYISFSEISTNSVSLYDFYFYKWNGTTTKQTVQIKNIGSLSSQKANSEYFTYCKINGKVYSYDYGDTNVGVYKYFDNEHDGSDGIKSKFALTAKRADADFRSRSEISYTNIEKYASITPASGKSSLTNSSTMTITANTNLPEGWYRFFYKSDNGTTGGQTVYSYIYFYLRADTTLEDGTTCTLANGSIGDTDTQNKKYAVLSGDKITIKFSMNMISSVSYPQAQYTSDENAITVTKQVNKYNFNQHEFKDWILYGTDWNSWFNKDANTGLFNYALTKTVKFVKTIISGTEVKTKITELDCSTDKPTDPMLSLGLTGQTTIDTIDGNLRSYEAAYIVYHANRGTWYYLPSNTTKLTAAVSKVNWISHSDSPATIDLTSFEKGSLDLQDDINKRQVSSTTLFGAVDDTYDAIWVPLPSERTVLTTKKAS